MEVPEDPDHPAVPPSVQWSSALEKVPRRSVSRLKAGAPAAALWTHHHEARGFEGLGQNGRNGGGFNSVSRGESSFGSFPSRSQSPTSSDAIIPRIDELTDVPSHVGQGLGPRGERSEGRGFDRGTAGEWGRSEAPLAKPPLSLPLPFHPRSAPLPSKPPSTLSQLLRGGERGSHPPRVV